MKKLKVLARIIVIFSTAAVLMIGCEDEKNKSPVDLKAPAAGTEFNLTILHTNDLHGNVLPFGRHNMGGLARIGWLVNEIRSINDSNGVNTLVFDAGDTRDGTHFNDATGTSGLWHIFNMVGYDATVMGNHDHIFGIRTMYENLTTAFADDITTDGEGNPVYGQKTKVVWGNVNPTRINLCPERFVTVEEVIKDSLENAFEATLPATDERCLAEKYSAVIERSLMTEPEDNTSKLFNQTVFYDFGDLRVGLFGITTDDLIYTFIPGEKMLLEEGIPELPAGVVSEGSIFYNTDPRNTDYVNQVIDYLDDPDDDSGTDDGADIIICLSHTGTGGEINIARYAKGPESGRYIDVIVGGHSHTLINKAIEIEHENGLEKTLVVQADWGGIFLGRVDLYITGDNVYLANSALIQVDSNVPEDNNVKNYIEETYTKTGGVNDWFSAITGVLPSDEIGQSEVDLDHDRFDGESPLGNFAVNAFYWQGHANSIFTLPCYDDNDDDQCDNPDATVEGSPGRTDFAIMVPFVLHTGIDALLKGPLTAGLMLDTLHIHDLTPDPSQGNTMHIVELAPLDAPLVITQPGYEFIFGGTCGVDFECPEFPVCINTHVEQLLEVIYGLGDLFNALDEGGNLGGLIQSYIGDLQWAGITFVVDLEAHAFDRIDPASIKINNQAPQSDMYYHFSLNSTIARFLGGVGALLGDTSFIHWDLEWSDTSVTEWMALFNYVRNGLPSNTITADSVAIKGGGVRSLQPDLTLQRWDISFDSANPMAGDTIDIRSWIINTGMTSVYEANIVYTYDPTPSKLDDNPDGYTDSDTGFYRGYIGTDTVCDVPRYSNYPGVKATNGIQWTIPADTPPGEYLICAEIRNVSSSRPEILTGNNVGKGLCSTLEIR